MLQTGYGIDYPSIYRVLRYGDILKFCWRIIFVYFTNQRSAQFYCKWIQVSSTATVFVTLQSTKLYCPPKKSDNQNSKITKFYSNQTLMISQYLRFLFCHTFCQDWHLPFFLPCVSFLPDIIIKGWLLGVRLNLQDGHQDFCTASKTQTMHVATGRREN